MTNQNILEEMSYEELHGEIRHIKENETNEKIKKEKLRLIEKEVKRRRGEMKK